MPDGLLQWYDSDSGEGLIVKGNREYRVRRDDMEPHARVPGARVHFDVKRQEDRLEAVDVRLRSGTRVPRRQQRVGRAGHESTTSGPPDTGDAEPEAQTAPEIEVVARSPRSQAARAYAQNKVARVIGKIKEPVLHARVKLIHAEDPAVDRPALVQATLDVNGDLVRAQAAGHTMNEAVDQMERRLRTRLEHRSTRRDARRRAGAMGKTWRHGQVATVRPPWFDRAPEDREVVRHKAFALGEITVDEAAFDMELLDFDFYLFRELASGSDALLRRLPDGGFGLIRARPSIAEPAATTAEVTLEPRNAPVLPLVEAVEWLDTTADHHVFFVDSDRDRGVVLYRRYDGHYGVIEPADEPASLTEPAKARRRLRAELKRLQDLQATLEREGFDRSPATERTSELASVHQHPADLASDTFEREWSLSLCEEVAQEITEVQRALIRLNQGAYGRCEACGRAIASERLQERPATRFCVEHQEEAEHVAARTRASGPIGWSDR